MNELYNQWHDASEEATKYFSIALKNHIRVSSPNKGDYEVEMDTLQGKIAFYNDKMCEYENKHPEEFKAIAVKQVAPSKMVRQSYSKNKDNFTHLRPDELTEQILKLMITNTFIHSFERALSSDKPHWNKSKITPPNEHSESYVFWYCYYQAEAYRVIVKDLSSINWANFKHDFEKVLSQLEQRNTLLKSIVPNDREVSLVRHLTTLSRFVNQMQFDLITCFDTENVYMKLKSDLKGYIELLVIGLLEVSKEVLNCMDMGGIETTEPIIEA